MVRPWIGTRGCPIAVKPPTARHSVTGDGATRLLSVMPRDDRAGNSSDVGFFPVGGNFRVAARRQRRRSSALSLSSSSSQSGCGASPVAGSVIRQAPDSGQLQRCARWPRRANHVVPCCADRRREGCRPGPAAGIPTADRRVRGQPMKLPGLHLLAVVP